MNEKTQVKLQRNSRVFQIPNESDMCRFVYKLFVRVKKSPFYFQPRGDLKKIVFNLNFLNVEIQLKYKSTRKLCRAVC